jgi:hypothetical protein
MPGSAVLAHPERMAKNPLRDRVLAPPGAATEPPQAPAQQSWTREAYEAALRGRRVLSERIDHDSTA